MNTPTVEASGSSTKPVLIEVLAETLNSQFCFTEGIEPFYSLRDIRAPKGKNFLELVIFFSLERNDAVQQQLWRGGVLTDYNSSEYFAPSFASDTARQSEFLKNYRDREVTSYSVQSLEGITEGVAKENLPSGLRFLVILTSSIILHDRHVGDMSLPGRLQEERALKYVLEAVEKLGEVEATMFGAERLAYYSRLRKYDSNIIELFKALPLSWIETNLLPEIDGFRKNITHFSIPDDSSEGFFGKRKFVKAV